MFFTKGSFMKHKKSPKKTILVILLYMSIQAIIINLAIAEEVLLPDNLVIETEFQPGYGLPVGKISIVQGDVIIMHQQIPKGYPAKKGTHLYKSDTLFCLNNSRVSFEFNDGSILSLGSNTQMVITESIFNASKRRRALFLRMKTGKARFGVPKLSNYNQSDFKVRTPTAIVGVRGSDFIIRARKLLTEVLTFQETVLEVVNLFVPDVMPVLLSDFERVVVEAEMLTSVVTPITDEEAEAVKHEFIFDENQDTTDESLTSTDSNNSTSSEAPKETDETEETSTDIVIVPDDEIVDPKDLEPNDADTELNPSVNSTPTDDPEPDLQEIIHEQIIKSEMPGLPGLPK
jgi:hypothetical protein